MELLKITDISRMIASTPLGPLMLQLRKGEKEYRLVLDSVPLEEELNKEIMELLFAKDTVPQPNRILETIITNSIADINGTSVRKLAVSNKKAKKAKKAKKGGNPGKQSLQDIGKYFDNDINEKSKAFLSKKKKK